MNENPEGTPNPLNPAPGTGEDMAAGTGPLEFVETANVSEEANEPEVTDAPKEDAPEAPAEEAPKEDAPVEDAPEASDAPKEEIPEAPAEEAPKEPEPIKPMHTNHSVVDPMMRPVSRNNFDTLGMNEDSIDNEPIDEILAEETIVAETPSPLSAPMNNAPELVAKDSIVEPVGDGSRKKVMIIGAITLLLIAIICGAAAAAILFVGNNNEDRVNKAIERLINGETSSIIAAQGSISTTSDTGDSSESYDVEFNGSFDMAVNTNTISAKVNIDRGDGNKASVGIDELKNRNGDMFVKLRGVDSLLGATEPVTDCTSVSGDTKCVDVTENATSSDVDPLYANLVKVIDNQWILISNDFSNTMKNLGFFDDSSTCLTSALGALPRYSRDIAQAYAANKFITYSTDDLEISKKKDTLYKLGIDDEKLADFIDSISGIGFANELNACAGDMSDSDDLTSDVLTEFFDNFPTVYVEIDDEYNFTRVFFKGETEGTTTGDCQCVKAPCDCDSNESSMSIRADFNLSYPNKLEIRDPENYMDVSEVITRAIPVTTN